MAFSQSAISNVNVQVDGTELFVSWTSSAPPDTTYQVYVDHRLSWFGMAQQCHVPIPSNAAGRNVWVEVGTVDPGDASVDFSSSLTGPGGPGDRALLSWLGGTYLDPTGNDDVQGFFVFQSSAANAPINYTAPVDSMLAYPGGWISDGFGQGGFGQGGFGRGDSSYRWTASNRRPRASGNSPSSPTTRPATPAIRARPRA